MTVKKPEAESSTPYRVSTTDMAQVTWWLPKAPKRLSPEAPQSLSPPKPVPGSSTGRVGALWGGWGPLLTLGLLKSPKHKLKPN